MQNPYQSLFISHGGGPLPLLGDGDHQEMVLSLKNIAAEIPTPDALVVVSAHWEERIPTITAGANPGLIYDYYGFPKASYEIRYPCPGEPALARKIQHLLDEFGMPSALDEERGFDHGLFVPIKVMYPAADIPCVQLSLVESMDPSQHIQIGRALQQLSAENVLVVGSGFSFHNLRAFFQTNNRQSQTLNESFEAWLVKTCEDSGLSETERVQRLLDWADAPGAHFCHPREEHLLPLHVCYGVAETPCRASFELTIMGRKTSMYLW